jgi:hypothetical protein
MVGQAKVIVGAQVQYFLATAYRGLRLLGRTENPLPLEKPARANAIQLGLQVFSESDRRFAG